MVYIIFILLLLMPDIYISRNFIHTPAIFILYWLPTIIAFYAIYALRKGSSRRMLKTLFTIVLCLGVPKLIFAVTSFLGWPLAMAYPPLEDIFNVIGFVLLAISALAMLYGITLGWQWFRTDRKTIELIRLPNKFDGLKIVQISDLHLGTFGRRRAVCRKLLKAVNNEKPDIIVFTGDLVNNKASEVRPFVNILDSFKAKYGIFSVLGNHDYCIYGDFEDENELKKNILQIINTEKKFGWEVLINQNKAINIEGQEIYIIGVENNGKPPFPMRADLNKAMTGIPEHACKILLSHDPSHWREQVLRKTDIDLMLSGHTHGMQFSFLGFNPAVFVYREWGGIYKENNQILHVSLGVGGNMAFRFGAWAEINVITLKTAK